MRYADVRLVIGTRPEAIKLAPLAAALRQRGVDPLLLFTGQHPRLEPAEYGLGDYRSTLLSCAGRADPFDHACVVRDRLVPAIAGAHLIVVQGDTSSAYGGALAAQAAGIPLAHVEAGLRTHDPKQPWPEESFRVAIDALADLLFAPTELSASNLRAEGLNGAIHVTGNTSIDAVLAAVPVSPTVARNSHLLVTCHRRENWAGGLDQVGAALLALAGDGVRSEVILPPNRHVADRLTIMLGQSERIQLIAPCGHSQMLARMRSAALVLSDSGGIQEEAPALGVPLLVLRDKTERPEAIVTGNMILIGTGRERIVTEVRRLLADPVALAAMSQPALPYGDGRSGERIASIIGDWLADRQAPQLNRVVSQ